MDYTLAYMFTPRAQYLHEEIKQTHSKLQNIIAGSQKVELSMG